MINVFCPKCGAFNEDRNSWCIKCGYKIVAEPEKVVEPDTTEVVVGEGEPHKSQIVVKEKKPTDYLVWSILAAIFGSIAFGIVAVIFSGLTQTENSLGNHMKAEKYSAKAKLFCLISLGIGIVKLIAVILFFAFVSLNLASHYIYRF